MAEMKTLTSGSTTYEIVDAQARQNMFHAYRIDLAVDESGVGYTAENVDFYEALAEDIRSGKNVIVSGMSSMGDDTYGMFIAFAAVLIGTMIVIVFFNGAGAIQCTIAEDGSVTVAME